MKRLAVLMLLVFLITTMVSEALALNTAGSMLHLDPARFNHRNLTQLTWKAQIYEYDYTPFGSDPFRIRIEFNSVGFVDSTYLHACYVGAMIQNVGHTFPDDASTNIGVFPALGLYFTSLQADLPNSAYGVTLYADPTKPPLFGRCFQNIDGTGFSGKNIYTRQNVGTPSLANPITVRWTVTKGETVINPQGNFSKSIDGEWVQLLGTFVKWNFKVEINDQLYDVGGFYLPIEKAEYILNFDPLVLHQEYFGAAERILGSEKGTVRYTDMRAFDGTNWYDLRDWKITWRIDDEGGNLDNRFGWKTDGNSLISRMGHESDVSDCSRDVGSTFTINNPTTQPLIDIVDFDGNKKLTIAGTRFGDTPGVLINNVDCSDFIRSASNAVVNIKGKAKKLGLQPGDNAIQLIGPGGATSNIYIFKL